MLAHEVPAEVELAQRIDVFEESKQLLLVAFVEGGISKSQSSKLCSLFFKKIE